jgi:peptide-methionine (S)-S-oxide reductase
MKATYRDVCSPKTAHAESVQVEFDPNEVSYEDLVDVFCSSSLASSLYPSSLFIFFIIEE